jgi:hypothetical protein
LPHNEVRIVRVDRRAIENLQRWVNGGQAAWSKEAYAADSFEMRRSAIIWRPPKKAGAANL